MMASCQAARLPLAVIFCFNVLVWGRVTVTVKLGLPALSGAFSPFAQAKDVVTDKPKAKTQLRFFMFLVVNQDGSSLLMHIVSSIRQGVTSREM
jgi:hypothetical protein